MLLVDARRLTGPNLLSRSPLVVVELTFEPGDPADLAEITATYLEELGRMRAALGYEAQVDRIIRPHRGGAVIAYEAPLDLMLPHTEMAEWAALSAIEILAGRARLPLEPKRAEVATMLGESQRSSRLQAIAEEARRRDLPFLWDDDSVSVGVGAGERSIEWPRTALPPTSGDVPWTQLGRIPIALITGTNGKTTSTRLLAHVVREAGHDVGCSSSDAILMLRKDGRNEIIDDGDYTGPAATRMVLRRKDIDFAVLETARGGILRRGLAIETCDAALITNVSEDHTGGYGIDDLEAMTRVKAVIADAVRPSGTVVLNAHDSRLVVLADRVGREKNVTFFADLERRDDPSASEVIRGSKQDVIYTEGDAVWGRDKRGEPERIVAVADIPVTFNGAARYNVENVLGVVGMARALGLPTDAVARGLRSFRPSDNPGRGEIIERQGVRVMLDFGHNPEGVRAVMKLVASLRAAKRGKLTVVAGAAGDRTDREVREMTRAIAESGADRIFLRELVDYLRGRAPGEMPALFRSELVAHGVANDRITTASSEADALRQVFAAGPSAGDFVVVLVHLDHDEVHELLAAGAGPSR